jgi:hypothetical protein
MPFLKKIKDFLDSRSAAMELSPDRENEIIEKAAQFISNLGMEWPAYLLGQYYVPISTIMADTTLLPLAPFLEMIGIPGFEFTKFLEKKDNLKRLLNRIDELRELRESKG